MTLQNLPRTGQLKEREATDTCIAEAQALLKDVES